MNIARIVICFSLLFLMSTAQAHQDKIQYQPESHAPAGVMADHLHKNGEWMIGIKILSRDYEGLYSGSEKINAQAAADAGFAMIPTDMSMDMLMLDIMYAVTDDLTLMLMPQYMKMDMMMSPTPGSMPMMGSHHSMHHHHEVSGTGDTIAGALIRIFNQNGQNLHGTIAFSAPTGSVEEKMANGNFTHYGMQLGSGTWDLLPSLTYTAYQGALSWGTQLGAVLRLEDENKSGYVLGERYFTSGWAAYRVVDWASLSIRLAYEKQNAIRGHYNGPHNHSSPPDLQANYGGEFVDLGFGVNLVPQSGALAGVRLSVEWLEVVAEHYNGIQVGRDRGVNISLSKGF